MKQRAGREASRRPVDEVVTVPADETPGGRRKMSRVSPYVVIIAVKKTFLACVLQATKKSKINPKSLLPTCVV